MSLCLPSLNEQTFGWCAPGHCRKPVVLLVYYYKLRRLTELGLFISERPMDFNKNRCEWRGRIGTDYDDNHPLLGSLLSIGSASRLAEVWIEWDEWSVRYCFHWTINCLWKNDVFVAFFVHFVTSLFGTNVKRLPLSLPVPNPFLLDSIKCCKKSVNDNNASFYFQFVTKLHYPALILASNWTRRNSERIRLNTRPTIFIGLVWSTHCLWRKDNGRPMVGQVLCAVIIHNRLMQQGNE